VRAARLVERAGEHVQRVALPHQLLRQAVVEAPRALVVRRAVFRQVLQTLDMRRCPGWPQGPRRLTVSATSAPQGLDSLIVRLASLRRVALAHMAARAQRRGPRQCATGARLCAARQRGRHGGMRPCGRRGQRRTLCERMGSLSSLSTTLPPPSVDGPPTNSSSRAAQCSAPRHPPVMPAATCDRVGFRYPLPGVSAPGALSSTARVPPGFPGRLDCRPAAGGPANATAPRTPGIGSCSMRRRRPPWLMGGCHPMRVHGGRPASSALQRRSSGRRFAR